MSETHFDLERIAHLARLTLSPEERTLFAHQLASIVGYVEKIDEGIIALAGGAGTSRGTGGMRAKLTAASIATSAGIPMLIINGTDPEILYDICDGKPRGTYFEKQTLPQSE